MIDTRKLRKAMFDSGVTQTDLSRKTGISYSMINAVCNGRSCSIESAQRIAEALQIPVDAITAIEKGA